jgi:hypothetical protein
VLARSDSERHIIHAEIDLAASPLRWSGEEFKRIHAVGRRPELYRDLSPAPLP